MKSLDTNILIYAANKNCSEHRRTYAVIEQLLKTPAEWIVSDQVVFEYLRALSNRTIFSAPLSKDKAIQAVTDFRERCGASFCSYDGVVFNRVLALHAKGRRDRLYDIILATTLVHFGVKQFFTRNVKDFEGLGLAEVINPID